MHISAYKLGIKEWLLEDTNPVVRRRSSNWIHFKMKLIVFACVLILGRCFVFALEEDERIPDESIDYGETKEEPDVRVKSASPPKGANRKYQLNVQRPSPPEYFRPPPPQHCPSNYMFSCQPIVRPVGCGQGYGWPFEVAPQFNSRHQRCATPHQMTFDPYRAFY